MAGLGQNDREAARLYKLAAEQGVAVAQLNLAKFHMQCRGGLAQDAGQAARLYRLAADQGLAEAQGRLGAMYAEGRGGLAQDDRQAANWYRKAADQGEAPAQGLLGTMYSLGKGVPQDYVQAHMWLNLAAARGLPYAANCRDFVTAEMTPAQIAEAQRLAEEWKPTAAGGAPASKP